MLRKMLSLSFLLLLIGGGMATYAWVGTPYSNTSQVFLIIIQGLILGIAWGLKGIL